MNQSESYTVSHEGIIDGGTITYSADTDAGLVTLSGEVDAGPFSIIKEHLPPGPYPFTASELLSAAFSSVGSTPSVGPANFKVTQIQQTVATVEITSVTGQQVTGSAVLDISAEFVKLIGANILATVAGRTVNVVLTRKVS